MRILFVAMANSIHTARWVSQISDQGWDIHILNSLGYGEPHSDLRKFTVYNAGDFAGKEYEQIVEKDRQYRSSIRFKIEHLTKAAKRFIFREPPHDLMPLPTKFAVQIQKMMDAGDVRVEADAFGLSNLSYENILRIQRRINDGTLKVEIAPSLRDMFSMRMQPDMEELYKIANDHSLQLYYLIKDLKPDIIHTLETQAAGYQTIKVKKVLKKIPPWIHTIWGSDLYLFGRLKEHRERVREVVNNCDYFTCECQRDVELAKSFGLKGEVLATSPATGGFDLEECAKLRQPGKVSERRLIMVKGYQGWAYRALVAIRALERCSDILKGYTIAIYLGFTEEVKIAAELFSTSTGIPVKMIPYGSHQEMLRYHGQARISIGLNISDGLPNSFLEALVMGSFPIQSWTSCADEWIEDGKTGILVPPEDPEVVEQAIRRALADDDLVNLAAELNYRMAAERLDKSLLKPKAVEIYKKVAIKEGIIV